MCSLGGSSKETAEQTLGLLFLLVKGWHHWLPHCHRHRRGSHLFRGSRGRRRGSGAGTQQITDQWQEQDTCSFYHNFIV